MKIKISPETGSHKYSHLIFDKEAKVIQGRKNSLQQMVMKNVDVTCKNSEYGPQTLHFLQKLTQNRPKT